MWYDNSKRASELIAELQALIAEHGDLPVWTDDAEDGERPIERAKIREDVLYREHPSSSYPKRIMLGAGGWFDV